MAPEAMPRQAGETAAVLVIEPTEGVGVLWRDLWIYRELFLFLAWRDLLVRYKQTVLGAAWAALRPLLAMALFSWVFGRLAGLQPEGAAPYSLFVFAGLVPWQLVTQGLADAGNSLVIQSNLISKVYFPRLLVPASALAVSVADALVSLVLLAGLLAYHGIMPGPRAVLIPFLVLLSAAVGLGSGVWLSALMVRWRDVRVLVPFLLQLSLYASPVAYGSSLVPARWRPIYDLNPIAGIVDGFRWALLPGLAFPARPLLSATLISVLLLATGIAYFRRTERFFADVI